MLTYHLKNSLIPSEETDWKALVEEALGENVHPKRALGFCLAREALRECFLHFNIRLSIHELAVKKFHQLEHHPSLTISLAHSGNWGAAVVAKKSSVASIGIDIESTDRSVKPAIIERISHPQDLVLPSLSMWVLKEAIFKSTMNTGKFELPVEFSSLKIQDSTWSHESGLKGKWKLEEQSGLLIALAWIPVR